MLSPPPHRWDLQCWEDRLSQQVLKEKPSLFLPQGEGTSVLYCSIAQAAERGLIKASLWDGRGAINDARHPGACWAAGATGHRCTGTSSSCKQKALRFTPPWGPGSLKLRPRLIKADRCIYYVGKNSETDHRRLTRAFFCKNSIVESWKLSDWGDSMWRESSGVVSFAITFFGFL